MLFYKVIFLSEKKKHAKENFYVLFNYYPPINWQIKNVLLIYNFSNFNDPIFGFSKLPT